MKEGNCGLTKGSLEGELHFIFVMESGYTKYSTEGMCKVCIVGKGGGLVLKVSGRKRVLARTCF